MSKLKKLRLGAFSFCSIAMGQNVRLRFNVDSKRWFCMNISMRYFSILVVVSFSIFSFKYGFWSEASEASDSKIDTRAVSVLKGTITHVRDGDTFEINGIPVRISALDCAENSTPEGKKITRFAKKFLGKQAVCELTGAKTYDRVVGYCSIEGKDFARTMMNETSCKLWAKYDVWDRY